MNLFDLYGAAPESWGAIQADRTMELLNNGARRAELQAMREAFAEAEGIEVFGPDDGGAWQTERAMGIGARGWTPGVQGRIDVARERAYPGFGWAPVDELERTYGIPYAWRVGLDQWPELPQPTWNKP